MTLLLTMRAAPRVVAMLILLVPAHAAAGEGSEVCARAAEHAQVLRSAGKLRAASEALLLCVRPSCPAFLRRDCATWQGEIDASLPSIVISARDSDGHDLADVRVSVDGVLLLTKLDGLEKRLDPGEHALRFETGSAPVVEQHVILREGEKRRPVAITFETKPATTLSPPSPAIPSRSEKQGVSPLAYVFGGAGLLSLGGFAYLGLTGLGDYHDLKNGCGRTGSCAPSDVSAARTKLWIADALLAVSVVSFGAATWFFFQKSPEAAPTSAVLRLEFRPTFAGASGSF